METTSVSLLDRLKAKSPSSTDWKRLEEIYLPLIQYWLRRVPGLDGEADDLSQDVFVVVLREIASFERRREGSFRAWLRQVTVNRVRSRRKARQRRPAVGLDPTDDFLNQVADPNSELARQWDREHDRHVVGKLLAIVQPDFQPETWQAFRRFALDGLPASEVARELQVSVNAVLRAKSRILKRLREESADLMD
jgi:RNA polymerase sigma-70 factor (ECF subfamily)